jgi:histidine phosphotransferase ChpT
MSALIDMKILAHLSARLCHELISPIGAIANGVELLGEDDPEFVREATALIAQSARKAGQRLQFYRFAYGSTATGGAAGPDPRELIDGLLEGGKLRCAWRAGTPPLPVEWQKLGCNMVVIVAEALPRGGTITVAAGPGAARRLTVIGAGEAVNVTEEGRAALALEANLDELTSRTVHAYFTARLAASLGGRLTLAATEPGRVILEATA